MKKILCLLVLLLCVVGCSGNKELTTMNLKEVASDLDKAYGNMAEFNKDELALVYGVDVKLCEEYVVKSSTLSNGDFYAILKVKNENKKEIVSEMKNLFSILEANSNLYSPEAVKLIKNRLETSVGEYYIYLVGTDTKALYEIIKNHIK